MSSWKWWCCQQMLMNKGGICLVPESGLCTTSSLGRTLTVQMCHCHEFPFLIPCNWCNSYGTHTAKFPHVLVRSHACVQVMHRSELLELSLYLLFIFLSVFAGIKRRTIIEYHRVAFMKEQIEQGTVIILTPLPSESIAAWPVLRVAKLYMHWKFRTNFDNDEIFVKLHWCIICI